MSVKLIVFNNGLQIVGDLIDTDKANGKVVVEKPVSLIFVPRSEADQAQGKVGMAFAPFMQYAEEWKTGITFSVTDVLTVLTPTTEVLNNYNTNFGSGIVLPGNPLQ